MVDLEAVNLLVTNWAQMSFAEEIRSSFARARTFDSYLSRLVLAAVTNLDPPTLTLLGKLLPRGAGSTGPTGQKILATLAENEANAVIAFRNAVDDLRQSDRPAFADYVVRQREAKPRVRSTARVAIKILKSLASQDGFTAGCVEPSVWSFEVLRKWGKFVVLLDFHSALELSYSLFVYDTGGIPIRQFNHYLGVLGIGPSIWHIEDRIVDEATVKAYDFAKWHVSEYDRIFARFA